MDTGILTLLTIFISTLMFFYQRAEAKKRLIVLLAILIAGELIRRYVWFRDVHGEAWLALFIASFLNIFFWLFIGRYNPVASSDEIQVIGLDD